MITSKLIPKVQKLNIVYLMYTSIKYIQAFTSLLHTCVEYIWGLILKHLMGHICECTSLKELEHCGHFVLFQLQNHSNRSIIEIKQSNYNIRSIGGREKTPFNLAMV